MKYRKADILKTAFHEFLFNGYGSPIITCLQKKLGMSRGAVYRHYRNKEHLFESVIDHYFFDKTRQMLGSVIPGTTLREAMDMQYRKGRLFIHIYNDKMSRIAYVQYVKLIKLAQKHYPSFTYEYRSVRRSVENYWRNAFENSIKTQEIRSDTNIDLMSRLFTDIYLMENGVEETSPSVFNARNCLKDKKDMLFYLYDLIKI